MLSPGMKLLDIGCGWGSLVRYAARHYGVSAVGLTISREQQFIMEDWHNIGVDYNRTLLAWHENFERSWPSLQNRYSERFYRMWRYYLLSVAGCFRARALQVWQVVMSLHGKIGGYTCLRYPACTRN
jgi:cyclopropane fatty-acyl-phospholipid synthase-like methyltransferase